MTTRQDPPSEVDFALLCKAIAIAIGAMAVGTVLLMALVPEARTAIASWLHF